MGSVVIVGGGAIGTWLAVRLSAAKQDDVTLLARNETVNAAKDGLFLETLARADPEGRGRAEHAIVRAVALASDLPPSPDLVVFAVRAYQTADAANALVDAGIRPKAVLTLQNGLGNAETLAAAFGAEHVLAGTTSHGVTLVAAGRARHAGPGETYVGPWSAASAALLRDVCARLDAARIQTRAVDDPRLALWTKVAVNAAINPPTALHRVPNGALLDGDALERDLRAAAREVAAVAAAEGVPLDAETAEAKAVEVARFTAENRSSMLQARDAGRPLETDAITGEVVSRAAKHDVDVPVNARHLAALRALAGTSRVER